MLNLTRRTELVVGTLMVFLMLGIVVGIFRSLTGGSRGDVVVSATISQIGDSLEVGNIVTYREVIVGDVRSFEPDGEGGAQLVLGVRGDAARAIPQGVTAVGVPADLFGQTAVVLEGDIKGGRGLRSGDRIEADQTPGARGLQSALAQAYDVINTVEPARLNAALTALSTALEGNGKSLGQTIDAVASLTQEIRPVIPELGRVLRQVAVVSQSLARNSPALLQSVDNLLTPARAIVEQEQDIARLLAAATPATKQASAFLREVGDDVVTIVTNSRPVLDAVAANAEGLSGSITGFASMAEAFNSVIRDGRVNLNAYVTGVNAAALVPVVLGLQTHILDSTATPFPNSPSDRSLRVQTGTNTVPGSTVGGPDEVAATQTLLASLAGVEPSQVPEGTNLLLGPLLRGVSTVIR